jgi:hypothetical protein
MAEGRGATFKKILCWLIGLPVLAGAVLFALANRGALTLSFWPSQYAVTLPAFAIVFAAVLAGVAVGGFAAWLAFGRKRALLRERAREVRRLEGEIEDLKRRLSAAEGAAGPAPGAPANDAETTRRQLVAIQS